MIIVNENDEKIGVEFTYLGNETGAEVTFFHNESVYTGSCKCHVDDNFVKATGRKIALSRAIAELPREERKKIWNSLWASGVRK